jgi:hypothetical protein
LPRSQRRICNPSQYGGGFVIPAEYQSLDLSTSGACSRGLQIRSQLALDCKSSAALRPIGFRPKGSSTALSEPVYSPCALLFGLKGTIVQTLCKSLDYISSMNKTLTYLALFLVGIALASCKKKCINCMQAELRFIGFDSSSLEKVVFKKYSIGSGFNNPIKSATIYLSKSKSRLSYYDTVNKFVG